MASSPLDSSIMMRPIRRSKLSELAVVAYMQDIGSATGRGFEKFVLSDCHELPRAVAEKRTSNQRVARGNKAKSEGA
jgi:hypothetical protein